MREALELGVWDSVSGAPTAAAAAAATASESTWELLPSSFVRGLDFALGLKNAEGRTIRGAWPDVVEFEGEAAGGIMRLSV